jgi:hypothetical protein
MFERNEKNKFKNILNFKIILVVNLNESCIIRINIRIKVKIKV